MAAEPAWLQQVAAELLAALAPTVASGTAGVLTATATPWRTRGRVACARS